MKVLFIGPSLHGEAPDLTGIVVRAPARQGDIAKAVLDGAGAIGLVDGYFDAVAAPWHKEILFALGRGVTLFGSSSMGALRAAECAPFGMRPVGLIAEAYRSGALDDDAAVAISHGPAELGYPPVTEPLVNVKPSLDRLLELHLLTETEHQRLWQGACRLHFKARTIEALFPPPERPELPAAYRQHRINQKAQDALQLIAELQRWTAPDTAPPLPPQPSSFFSKHILPKLADNAT
jgi:hypothetical protein